MSEKSICDPFFNVQVKHLVEAGGGVILNQPTLSYRDYMIRLLVSSGYLRESWLISSIIEGEN